MKTINKIPILMMLAIVVLASSSCSKKSTPTPASTNISLLVGTWATNYWGGVQGDNLQFTVVQSSATATVVSISGAGYGFAVGNVIFSDIKANGDGTYSCSASYSPTGSGQLSTRSATMSLQNNNSQLTVYYPAINSSFPAITYIFQKPV